MRKDLQEVFTLSSSSPKSCLKLKAPPPWTRTFRINTLKLCNGRSAKFQIYSTGTRQHRFEHPPWLQIILADNENEIEIPEIGIMD